MTTGVRPAAWWWPSTGIRRLALLGLARGGAALLGLLGVLLVAHALTPDQLGHWSLALAVQGYALHLGEFGLRSVVTTEAARAGRLLPQLLRRYLALRLALSLAALAIVLLGALLVWPQQALLMLLVTLSILPIALQLDWLALVDDRAQLAAGLLLLRPLAFLILVGLCRTSAEPISLAACYLVAWSAAAAVSWVALSRAATSVPGHLPTAGAMLGRGTVLALITISNQAQLSADLLAVGWWLGAARAGDYYLAGQILVAALLFANASGQIALARLPGLAGQPRHFAGMLVAEARQLIVMAGAMALGLACLAPQLLPRLFGPGHAGAVTALLWLLPWFLLQHPTTLLQAALTAARRERAVLGANVVLLAVLVPGLMLAATGTTVAAFAAARSAAEIARLLALAMAMRLTLAARPLSTVVPRRCRQRWSLLPR